MIPQELLRDLPYFLRAEVEENQVRKDFTQSEIAEAQEMMRRFWEKRFRRGALAGRSPEGKPIFKEAGSASLKTVGPGYEKVDDLLGEAFTESRETVRKRRAVYLAAREDPGRFGTLLEEMDSLNRVEPIYRKLQAMLSDGAAKGEENGGDAPAGTKTWTFRLSATDSDTVQTALDACGGDPNAALVAICLRYVQLLEPTPTIRT